MILFSMHDSLVFLDPICNKYCDLIVRVKYLENHVSSVEKHVAKCCRKHFCLQALNLKTLTHFNRLPIVCDLEGLRTL